MFIYYKYNIYYNIKYKILFQLNLNNAIDLSINKYLLENI